MTTPAHPSAPESPYKGLVPYFEEDAPFFFGRRDEQEIIAANLQAYRLTLLYGPSGVGKSSVLRAGVAHHLREAARATAAGGVPESIVVVFSSWRDDPVVALLDAIRSSLAKSVGTAVDAKPAESLSDTLAQWTTGYNTDLLVILDQFEEYFLYHPETSDEQSFAHQFARAVNKRDLRVNFLVSIRDDALSKLDRFKGRIATLFDNYLRIDHLGREAAAEAIERPLVEYNERSKGAAPVAIEPALTQAVLDQLGTGQVTFGSVVRGDDKIAHQTPEAGDRIETPLLQLVMTRLWKEERAAASNVLRLETLNRLGGAERIVRTHLDAAMSTLTPAERLMAARAFRYLVTPSGTKIAHTLVDLADYSGMPHAQLATLAEKLSSGEARILRPVSPAPGPMPVARYEIFHDVLASAIADWRRRTEAEQRRQVDTLLRPLHRWAWTLGTTCFVATAAVAAPFLAAIWYDPDSSEWSVSPFPVAATMLVGLLLMGGIVVWSIRRSANIVSALRAGFTWTTVADVIADRRRTLGDLIAGRGKYDSIAPAALDTIRRRQRHQASLWLMTAAAPAAGIVAVVALGSRDLIGPSNAPAVVIGPSLSLLLAGGALSLMNAFTLRRAQRKASTALEGRRDPHPGHDPLDGLVAAESFGAARQSSTYAAMVWAMSVSLLWLATVLATLPVAFTVIGAPALAADPFTRDVRLRQTGIRLPPDPAETPLSAGRAYYTLAEAGREIPQKPYEYLVPRKFSIPPIPEGRDSPFGKPLHEVAETLIEQAAQGFTEPQRKVLETLAKFEGLSETADVARAATVDYLGARFRPGHPAFGVMLPIPLVHRLSAVPNGYMAKAALELADGRAAESEGTLREMVSFAVVMIVESHSTIEIFSGDQLLTTGLRALEQLYRQTGQTERAAEVRRWRDAGSTVPEIERSDLRTIVMQPSLRILLQKVAENVGQLRGMRWEALTLAALLPCTNAREVVFGPSERITAMFSNVRSTLVRFPSEQEFVENIRLTIERFARLSAEEVGISEGAVHRISRVSGVVFSNERIKACPSIAYLVRMLY